MNVWVSRVLRFGTGYPREVLTGDDTLDEYLRDLNSQFVGVKKIRRSTLAEAKDHLVEARDSLIAEGVSPAEASRNDRRVI